MLAQLLQDVDSADLIALGMQAAAVRKEVLGPKIVSYTSDPSSTPRLVLADRSHLIRLVSDWKSDASALVPLCGPGLTATDYLRLIAVCRLTHPALHIEVDLAATGLKVGQLALSFGADDLGSINGKPGSRFDEEEIRRIIRDAGFEPRHRNADYKYYLVD